MSTNRFMVQVSNGMVADSIRALTPTQMTALQALVADGVLWISAADVHAAGVGATANAAGLVLSTLARLGLVIVQRARNTKTGPNLYQISVHGRRVLDLESRQTEIG